MARSNANGEAGEEQSENEDSGGGRSVLGIPRRLGRLVGIGAPDPVRRALLTVAIVGVAFPGVVMAQSQAQEAGGLLCGTGLGTVVGLAFGTAALVLLGLGGWRGTWAWKKMGAPRPDQKKEGRDQLKGAGITAVGAFVPAAFGLILDTMGVGAFSCIDWQNIINVSAALVPVLPF